MGQATLKATRRQLRRAVGADGLAVVQDHDHALAILQNALATCQREIASLALHHTEQRKAHASLRDDVTSLQADVESLLTWRTQGWWANLRWVFTGK